MKISKQIILLFFTIITTSLIADDYTLDLKSLAAFANLSPIQKDNFLSEHKSGKVMSRMKVEKVIKSKDFKKGFRIVGQCTDSSDAMSIIFNIYTENSEYETLLNTGALFDFKGQLVVFTPLNARRDRYVLDIILEDGSLVIDGE